MRTAHRYDFCYKYPKSTNWDFQDVMMRGMIARLSLRRSSVKGTQNMPKNIVRKVVVYAGHQV